MPFIDPDYFASVPWATREDPRDDESALVEIRPGELDTVTTAARRVAWYQLANSTTWPVWAAEVGAGHAIQERALGSVDQARYLSTAEGQVLDEIGALVGLARNGLDDATYRLAIRTEAGTLWTSGTIPEIVSLARGLLGDDMRVREYYPGLVVIAAPDIPTAVFLALLGIMADVPAAGVAGVLETWDSEETYGWASTRDPLDEAIPIAGSWSTSRGASADDAPSPWSTGRALE